MSESSDTLRSTSYARLVDLISEGPIEGLVNGAKSIFLNETRLQNDDGSFNFSGFNWTPRLGTLGQDYVPGFAGTEQVVNVGVQCRENIPVVRTITNPNVDAVNVIIGIPQLSRTDRDTGDIEGTSVRIRVQVQAVGDSTWQTIGSTTDVLALQAVSATQVRVTSGDQTSRAEVRLRAVASNNYTRTAYRISYRVVGAPSWVVFEEGSIQPDKLLTYSYTSSGAVSTYVAEVAFTRTGMGAATYEWKVEKLDATPTTLTLSGSYWRVLDQITIAGKSSSRYQRQIRVTKPTSATGGWSVRVVRMSNDSTSAYLQNDTVWDSYVEVTEEKMRYPLSALVAMSIDAKQFSSVPSRAYDVRLLIVKVPTNYNPLTRTYTGTWDGTFKDAWTDNPAWCFYDLLTNKRYGLGAFVGTGVDKWALYQIGQYCDELVPDGFGGQEPRFTCNLLLNSRAEAFKVVNDMASIFRGLVFWASGSITAVQDAPSDPVALYAPANVIDGQFSYQGSSAKARHTVAMVSWNDPDNLSKTAVEYVEDAEGVARYGIINTEVVAVGCSSRGQANRVGRWLLYTERMQTDVVTFKCGLDTALCRPGDVIAVADPLRAGVRMGGRLLASTTSQVTIDAPVTLVAGQTYQLSCLRFDGAVMTTGVNLATTGTGSKSVLKLSTNLPEAPAVSTMWVLAATNVEPQLFQVLAVVETEPNVYEVSAVSHRPDKFAAVETGALLTPRSYSVLAANPAAPSALTVTEALYASGQVLATRLDVSWQPVDGANAYAVSWRRTDGTRMPEAVVFEPTMEIDGAQDGQVYDLQVYAINTLGARSAAAATLTHTVLGKQALPSDVSGFVVARDGNTLNFTWRAIADLDAARYEVRRGDTWDTGILAGTTTHPGNVLSVQAPRGGRFLVKAVDTSGNYSASPAIIDAADLSGINVVVTHDEAAGGWTGTNAGTEVLTTSSSPPWDSTTTWATTGTWDAFVTTTGIALQVGQASGTYTTAAVDLGYVTTATLSIDATIRSLGPLAVPWSTLTQPWAYYDGAAWIWQQTGGDLSAGYEISTSEDGTTWSAWAPFVSGAYRCRYLKLRVTLATVDGAWRPFLTVLTLFADVPDRVLRFADVAVPTGGATISFSPPFVGVATVQATLQSASVGDTVKVTAKSTSSVTVQVFNSAGSPKAATVDVDAYGYGERS